MSKASDFAGGNGFGAISSVVRGATFDGAIPTPLAGVSLVNTPALVANVAQDVLNVSGKGFLNYASFRVAVQVLSASRIFTVRVIIDGVTVITCDATACQTAGQGHILVGNYYRQSDGVRHPVIHQPIPFKTSLRISVACAIADIANYSATAFNYELYA